MTFLPSEDAMNNSNGGSCDVNAGIGSLHVKPRVSPDCGDMNA